MHCALRIVQIVGQGWPRAWWAVKWGEIRLRIYFSGLDIKIIRGLAKSFAWGKARGLLNVSTIREPNAGRRA